MARYVIDAPTLLHLLDNDLQVDPGHQLGGAQHHPLGGVAAAARRRYAAARAPTRRPWPLHRQLTELKMRLLGDRMSRGTAWKIARERDWDTLRDAEYLAVTRLQADALVTVDPALVGPGRGHRPGRAARGLAPAGLRTHQMLPAPGV